MIHAFRFDILILLILVAILTLNMTMGGKDKSDSVMLNSICAQHGEESDSPTSVSVSVSNNERK